MTGTQLEAAHLEAILGLVRRVTDCDDVATFRTELADGLGEVIDGDLHYVTDLDAGSGELEIVQRPEPLPMEVTAAFLEHRHPIVEHYLDSGDGSAIRLSDLVTPEEWRAMPLFEVYQPHRVNHQLGATVPYPESRVLAVGINREGDDFSPTDVAVLDRLRPHLVQSIRNAEVREHLADLVEGTAAADGVHGVAMVSGDRIEEADEAVADTIRTTFSGRAAARLPDGVARWADGERRRLDEVDGRTGARMVRPLVDAAGEQRVVLRLVPGDEGDAVVVDQRAPDDARPHARHVGPHGAHPPPADLPQAGRRLPHRRGGGGLRGPRPPAPPLLRVVLPPRLVPSDYARWLMVMAPGHP